MHLLDRWRLEGDDMKSVNFVEIYGPKSRPCWLSCPLVTEQDEEAKKVTTTFLLFI